MQKEHESLRGQIIGLTSTVAGRTEAELCSCDCTINIQKHKQLTDNTIANLQAQYRLLNDERDTLNTLWRTSEKTITNLEVELAEYKRLWRQPDSVMQVCGQIYQYRTSVSVPVILCIDKKRVRSSDPCLRGKCDKIKGRTQCRAADQCTPYRI